MNKTRTIPNESPVWVEADKLLNQQPWFRQELAIAMKSSGIRPTGTTTGLYPDERHDDFPVFVHHVRKVLSRSPRTILRQAVNAAFDNPTTIHHEQQKDLKGLRHMLRLAPEAPVLHIARAMENLPKGKCHRRLQHTKQKMQEGFQRENGVDDLRDKVTQGLKLKRGKVPTPKEINKVIDRVHSKEVERLERLQEEVKSLEEELNDDLQFKRYCQATKLWKRCGGERLWRNYKHVDLAICKNRGTRGSNFETKCCDILFAMIVLQHSKNDTDGRDYSDYWYQRGVHWWHEGQEVGELDVVIYHKQRVMAVCEMKSSCFEIAAGPRQHETKLTAAAKSKGGWAIGATVDEAVNVSSQTIPLFLATMIPNGDNGGQVGAEPRLTAAVCHGIRSHGGSIVHASNLHLCRPLITMLKTESCLDDAIHYLESLPSCVSCPHDENDLDYEQLRCFVLKTMGAGQLVESPLGCLERFPQDHILVLPRSLV